MSQDRQPLRVLHTMPHLERGGTQRWLLGVIEGFAEHDQGIEHHVAVFGQRDEMLREFEACSAALYRLDDFGRGGPSAKVTGLRRLTGLARRLNAGLIQTHSRFDRPFAYMAGRLSRRAVINTLHSEFASTRYLGHGPPELRDRLEERLERRPLRGVLAVGPHLWEQWSAVTPMYRGRHLVLPPMVEAAFLSAKSPTMREGGTLRLIAVSRLVESKQLDLAIRALVEVQRDFPDATLSVVGDGPERDSLGRCSREAGIDPFVDFLGDRSDIPELLSRHDVFVLPTRTEGRGLAIIEAACVGLGVVAPRLPGLTGVVDDLDTFEAIESMTPHAVASAIRRVAVRVREPSLRQGSRSVLLDRVDRGLSVRLLGDFYRSVVEDDAARSRFAGRTG